MEPWMQTLANLGGVGAMALMLYFLHRDSIKNFTGQLSADRITFSAQLTEERKIYREQMEQTRTANMELWRTYMDLKMSQHQQVLAALAVQDKALDQLLLKQNGK